MAWSSGSYEGNRNRLPKGHELFAQDDGNLVLYTSNRGVAWASNTDTKGTDAYTLEVSTSRSMPPLACQALAHSVLTSPLGSAGPGWTLCLSQESCQHVG